MRERRNAEQVEQEGCRTSRIQERRDAEKEGCRKRGMQEWRDVMQEMMDRGNEI